MSTDKYDIVIVGAGPVGLLLSTCLARWGYRIKHVDNRSEPTKTGRADGIQPRSLDLLRNMGLKRAVMAHNPAKVFEVAFWDPSQNGKGIHRTGTWASCPKFIDARYPFTTLLHQGLIERIFIDDLKKHGVDIQRPWTITGFKNDGADQDYPVEVSIAHIDGGQAETVRAKYLFSGEGARSFIRQQLGVQITHKDPIAHVWGVMDGVVRTDFPDIKMKCTIHSDAGSIMVIPRENNMVRLYIQIASSTDKDWNPRATKTAEEVQATAKKIMQPYWIDWDRVEWFSVYPIGQGIADRYTLDERVFMGGDCCHTHSPKAGQGMNTAFLDAQNLAWKIHHVESGFADRSILKSYESERRLIADNLLTFDAKYAKLFSQRQPSAGEVGQAHITGNTEENQFVKTFKESCEFTSGYGVAYNANIFNWSETHPAQSPLFLSEKRGTTKQRPGRIMTAATVTRVADANVVHLEQEIPLNGAFRLYLFAGRPSATQRAVADFASNLTKEGSFYTRSARPDIKSVSYHERHNPYSHFFTIATIYNARRPDIEIRLLLPEALSRYFDHVYADDIWDQRVPEAEAAAHAKMGLSETKGGVVVVRPDGYVGCAVKLVEGNGTVDALNAYFASFMTAPTLGSLRAQLGPNLATNWAVMTRTMFAHGSVPRSVPSKNVAARRQGTDLQEAHCKTMATRAARGRHQGAAGGGAMQASQQQQISATSSRAKPLRHQHSRRCRSMAEISRRSSRQVLLSPDDTHSLTSFPDPEAQTLSSSPSIPSVAADEEPSLPPQPPAPPLSPNDAPSNTEPMYGLLDRSGPTMFDDQAPDLAQPQTLSTASADVLRSVIDHNGAVELVRRLSTMLAERDAHITALTRLCEEYSVPKVRLVAAASKAKQAERRRLSLATASEEMGPSDGSRSDSVVSGGVLSGRWIHANLSSRFLKYRHEQEVPRPSVRFVGSQECSAALEGDHRGTLFFIKQFHSVLTRPAQKKERPLSIDTRSIMSTDSGGWTTAIFGSTAKRQQTSVAREPPMPVEMSTQHDKDQLPPTLSNLGKDPHEDQWNRFLLKLVETCENTRDRADGGEMIGFSRWGQEGSVGLQKMKTLTHLVIGGIPMQLRHPIWMELSSTHTMVHPGAYHHFLSMKDQNDPTELDAIMKDVPRTLTTKYDFYPGKGYKRLTDVLLAFVAKYEGLGYTQGLNSIAGYLLLAIPVEEDAFWVLCNMVENLFPAEYFSRDSELNGPIADNVVLRQYVRELTPQLGKHLDKLEIADDHTVPLHWLFTAFSTVLPQDALMRLWDVWLCLPGQRTFIFNVALMLLMLNAADLLQCDSQADYWAYLDSCTTAVSQDPEKLDDLITRAWHLKKRLEQAEHRRNVEFKVRRRKRDSTTALYSAQ
nr:phenol hydroxylase [Quercus suber]